MGPNWSRLLNRDLDTLSDSVILVEDSMERFERMIGVVARASNSLSGIVQGLNKNFSGLGVTQTSLLNTYEKYIQNFDKLNRSAIAYGNSSQVIEKRISNLTKVTNLSNKELTELTSMIDSKLLGVRNYSNIDGMIKRVNDLGKSAEETRRMLDSLAQTQSKYGTGFGSTYGITPTQFGQMDRQSFMDLIQTNFMEPGQIQNRQREYLKRFQGARTRYEELELTSGRGITPFALGASEGLSKITQGYLGIDGAGALAGAGAIGTAAAGVVAAEWYRALFGGGRGRGRGGRSAGSGGMLGGGGGMPQMFGPGAAGAFGSTPVTVQNWPVSLSAGSAFGSRFGPMANGPQYFGPGGAPMGTGMSATMSGRLGGGVRMMLGRGLMGLGGAAAIGLGGYALSQSLESGYLDKLFPNNERGGTAKATVAGGIQGAMQGGMMGAGIGAMFGPTGMLVGGAGGMLVGSMMGASSAHKQAQDRQKQLDNSDKLIDIQKEMEKELMKENINQEKINELVKRHNDLVGETGQKLDANVSIMVAMYDKAQQFNKLQETATGLLDSQAQSLSALAGFYSDISLEGDKAESSSREAARIQLQSVDVQEAAYEKLLSLVNKIKKERNLSDDEAIKAADEQVKKFEEQFGVNFQILDQEDKRLHFLNLRTKAEADYRQSIVKEEEAGLRYQGILTQQAETYEQITKTAKVGIGAEVGAILNTARQYTKELGIQQKALADYGSELKEIDKAIQSTQNDQSLSAAQKIDKLKAQQSSREATIVKMEEKKVDILNSQSKILEKLLTLRQRYVEALPEVGFAGFDFEASFDVTRDTGLALFGAPNQFVGGRGGGGLRYTSGGVSPLGGQTGFAGPNAYGMFGPNNMTLGQGSSLGSAGAAQQAALQGYSSGGIVKRGQLRGPTGGWLAELHDTDAAVLTEQHLNKLGLTEQDLMSIGVPAFKGSNSSGTVPGFKEGMFRGVYGAYKSGGAANIGSMMNLVPGALDKLEVIAGHTGYDVAALRKLPASELNKLYQEAVYGPQFGKWSNYRRSVEQMKYAKAARQAKTAQMGESILGGIGKGVKGIVNPSMRLSKGGGIFGFAQGLMKGTEIQSGYQRMGYGGLASGAAGVATTLGYTALGMMGPLGWAGIAALQGADYALDKTIGAGSVDMSKISTESQLQAARAKNYKARGVMSIAEADHNLYTEYKNRLANERANLEKSGRGNLKGYYGGMGFDEYKRQAQSYKEYAAGGFDKGVQDKIAKDNMRGKIYDMVMQQSALGNVSQGANGSVDISGNVNMTVGFDQSGNLVVKNMQKQFVQNMRGSTNRSAGSPHAASVSGAPI